MAEPLIIQARKALSTVVHPDMGKNIVAAGMVKGLDVDAAGKVRFALEMPEPDEKSGEALIDEAKSALSSIAGVTAVSIVATAHSNQSAAKPPTGHHNPFGLKKPRIEEAGAALTGVKSVIAIASGKGGVGKSTFAANLSVALARQGLRVGLMDADIYGPSLPTLFGLGSRKAETRNGKILPIDAHGVKAMSIGLLVDEQQALAWRGPMVMGAVRQLISDVDWGELDLLLIDTPPGTGDAHLSLIQSKLLSGAVIISTPQEMALADVRRGVSLFQKTETPVIGIVENMAWLESPDGGRQYLFGQGGAKRAAEELDAPFLGELPFYQDLATASDEGRPLPADHPASEEFKKIAEIISDFIRRP